MNMIPNLETLGDADACIDRLHASREMILSLIEGREDLSLTPGSDDGEWTPEMVVEHIAIVEDSTARVIRLLRLVATGGRSLPDIPRRDGVLRSDGRMIAPDNVLPKGEMSRPELLAFCAKARGSLLDQVNESGELLDGVVAIPHPFFGDLNGLGWLRMAAFHENHHIAQIKRGITRS